MKRFMLVWESDPERRGTFHTLAEQLAANRDDDDYCEWLQRAEIGEGYSAGGGAAPACWSWRIS